MDCSIVVEPLRGMARTRMRAQSYPSSGDGRLVLAKRWTGKPRA